MSGAESIESKKPTVGVVGLGYVGLPLVVEFASKGFSVVGLDIDTSKVDRISNGQSYIQHISTQLISELVQAGRLEASTDFSRIANCEVVIICVPTPLSKHRAPDLTYILDTARQIGPYIQKGTLVVLESTTYPGTTEDELRPSLESVSGLQAGRDFFLAYSPEREDPGNPKSEIRQIPKVVGGLTDACTSKAKSIYSSIVKEVVGVRNCRVAEATKLLENIFRCVNIALVNELKVIYEAMDIDIWEVIDAASTKPFGFMPFYPGPGLGGHCIPIDPFYLAWKAREFGFSTRFIELAGEINTLMPDFVVGKISAMLNNDGLALKGSRILVMGLAYKANVDDDRESPAYALMDLLRNAKAEVSYYDPHIPSIPSTREHPSWEGVESINWDEESVRQFDLAVIVTAHASVNYQELLDWSHRVVDTRNVVSGMNGRAEVWKA